MRIEKLLAVFFVIHCLLFASSARAQTPRWGKMSPMLRKLVRSHVYPSPFASHRSSLTSYPASVCAFVRIDGNADSVLLSHHCQPLTRVGTISIANIPLSQLPGLSLDERVSRIEAQPSGHALMDTTALCIGAQPVYSGFQLPQAYTGRGVVLGIMDIGFDLTHPTFYDAEAQHYRIRRFWDMLSPDTLESSLYVGRDYVTQDDLLAVGHSYDGYEQTHGTHVLGIAAGSGYDSPYRGMAPESDICVVANGTTENTHLISPDNLYKYTYATDALGFKYIFDYAASCGQPCVVSFSEGSFEDLRGDDLLYYEMIDSLVGPGRILVAAAGNQGKIKAWFRKPAGQSSAGTFLYGGNGFVDFTLSSPQPFAIRVVAYHGSATDTLVVNTLQVDACPDSLFTDSISIFGLPVAFEAHAYPSCYDALTTCYDVNLKRLTPGSLGHASSFFVSLEVLGSEADVEFHRISASLETNVLNPELCAGESTHTIYSPSSSPSVICVGATTWRTSFVNHLGEYVEFETGGNGSLGAFSSKGPTLDGRIKPDVMAPGVNILSAYSSYYLERHSTPGETNWHVAHFPFRGRTYAWGANTGTSMAAPVVGGAVALWLQACPTLTPRQVLDVISRTSRRSDSSLTYPNNDWGWGEIDVYRGLLDVLGISSNIPSLAEQPTPLRVTVSDGRLYLSSLPLHHSPLTLRLYTLTGQQRLSATVVPGSTDVSVVLPLLPSGVYALQVSGDSQCAGSALVRIER
ncbi:MAG: S8 family serine peptidase [Prevotella sp.]|nr:S8 family serine peptidase [Prevotella sp.]